MKMKWQVKSIFLWTIVISTSNEFLNLAVVPYGFYFVGSLTVFAAMLIYRRRQRATSTFTNIGTLNSSMRSGNYSKPLLDITNYAIEVIENEERCEIYLQEQYRWPIKFIGLDCEWANSKGRHCHPVALLQVAFTNETCALLRLYKFTSLPPNLVQLLENRR